jgi:ubiquinol-cytochrome c reductase cytochrome c1 subunit
MNAIRDEIAETRERMGYAVLIFLGVLFAPVYLLKKEYWKDVH